MSLTEWVSFYKSLIDALFDKPAFNIKGEIKAEPLTKNYSTVGAAFDYALRLQISSINTSLGNEFPLVAEHGIKGNRKRQQFVNDFKEKRVRYLNGQISLNDLLPDCIILAKIESVFRSGRDYSNSDIFSVDEADIVDLQRLASLVGSSLWVATEQCLLNPIFGKSSLDLEGADADLIIDNRLIDIKTTKEMKFKREYTRQLVGYHILNMRENHMYGTIKSLGIYFSRFGVLFEFPTPEMNEIEVNGKTADAWEIIEDSIRIYNKFIQEYKEK